MKKLLLLLLLLLTLPFPVHALEIEAPTVPEAGKKLMPESWTSFSDGLEQLLHKAMEELRPDLKEAASVWVALLAVTLLVSVLRLGKGLVSGTADLTGAVAVTALLLSNTNSMVRLASSTVRELSDYGKLLFPVMAAALAAQGGVTGSTALYMGTTFFTTILNSALSDLFVGAVYFFLAFSLASASTGEEVLKKGKEMLKSAISWSLKTILTVFTTYMSITGVVSGTTDAAALKAMKVTISTVVPVVGGILSDASESVLVSAALMKNAAGIYGIFAVLSLALGPFLRIGIHYLLLKTSSLVCGMFGSKAAVSVIEDFSTALGLLLAVTGCMCMLLLIAVVCFMRGVT